MQQGTAHCTVPRKFLYKTNGFSRAKTEVMLPFVKRISKKKSLYTNTLHKKDWALDNKNLTSIDKATEMPDKIKDIKITDVKHIPLETKHKTSCLSRLGIKSI